MKNYQLVKFSNFTLKKINSWIITDDEVNFNAILVEKIINDYNW